MKIGSFLFYVVKRIIPKIIQIVHIIKKIFLNLLYLKMWTNSLYICYNIDNEKKGDTYYVEI